MTQTKQETLYKQVICFLTGGTVLIVLLCGIRFWLNSRVTKLSVQDYEVISETQAQKDYVCRCDLAEQKRSYTILRGYCYKNKAKQNIIENYLVVEQNGVYYRMPTEMLDKEKLNEYYTNLQTETDVQYAGFVAQVSNRYYSGQEKLYLTYRMADGTKVLVPMQLESTEAANLSLTESEPTNH